MGKTVEMEPTELKPTPFMQAALGLGREYANVPTVFTPEDFADDFDIATVGNVTINSQEIPSAMNLYLKEIAETLREIRDLIEENTVTVE